MSRPMGRHQSPAKTKGYSLIEVLLTLLILGIGILGLSAANLVALRARGQSSLESSATQLASDIMERMRAQPKLAREGAFNRQLLSPVPVTTASNPATRELSAWLTQLQIRLPSGAAAIAVSPEGRAQVMLQWNAAPPSSGATKTASMSLASNL